MADKKNLSAGQARKQMAETMWLDYFNQTLFDKGIITETERNRIQSKIASRSVSMDRTS